MVELIFVIGLIAFLIALLIPTASSVRREAVRVDCSTHLREIGYAIQLYANDNRSWIPRDATVGRDDRPPWPILFCKYLVPGRDVTIDSLPDVRILQCPEHPTVNIPTGYVINAFAFETAPNWAPDGPVKITSIRASSELPWMFDASNNFPIRDLATPDKIYGVEFHDVYDPRHLPGGERHRISDDRHNKNHANILYLDGHVSVIGKGELKLEMLDDRVGSRATTMPVTEIPGQ